MAPASAAQTARPPTETEAGPQPQVHMNHGTREDNWRGREARAARESQTQRLPACSSWRLAARDRGYRVPVRAFAVSLDVAVETDK